MAGSIQLVFALAIGLAVVCTGVFSKDCEECSIAKCQKIEGSSGKVYGENEKVALSATVCPDEQNCCSFKDTLYYVTGEFAPCACPDTAVTGNTPTKVNEEVNSQNLIQDGDKRVWDRGDPGKYEKEGFKRLHEMVPGVIKDPTKIDSTTEYVSPTELLVGELPKKDLTYKGLFADFMVKSTEQGAIVKRLKPNLESWSRKPKSERMRIQEALGKVADCFKDSVNSRITAWEFYGDKNENHAEMIEAIERFTIDLYYFAKVKDAPQPEQGKIRIRTRFQFSSRDEKDRAVFKNLGKERKCWEDNKRKQPAAGDGESGAAKRPKT